MYLKTRVRHAIVAVVLASAIATAVDAGGVAQADNDTPQDPAAATVSATTSPPEESPTSSPTPVASTVAPTPTDAPTTTAAATTPSTTPSTTTTPPAAIATTTTTPPAAIATTTTTPPAAIATTTTVAPNNAILTVVAFSVATAPLSPVATPGNGSVKLTWLAPSSNGGAVIDKYAVQRLVNGQWTSIAYPTGLSYTALGLTNGTKYYFRIRAHNAAGWSPVSTTVSAVPRTVPSAPTSLTNTPGDGWIALSWKPPTNSGGAAINMYMVQRATSLAGPWTTLPVQTPTNGIYTGLTNGTTYFFRVSAHNALWDANNGWSAFSYVVADVPRTVPGAPVSCSASNGSGTTYWVTFAWQPPSSNGGAAITAYRVELWKNGSLYSTTTAQAGSPYVAATEVGSIGLYYVRVRALNPAGFGPPCYTFVYV